MGYGIVIFVILISSLLLVGTIGLVHNYFKINIIELENLDESIVQGKDFNNPTDLKSIIEEVRENQILPTNPRIKVFYQGSEVAYIDHLGNIYGSSGWFTNLNTTTTNSTVFYQAGNILALNSSLGNYLIKTGDTMTGNLNFLTGRNITMNGNKIYSNVTCIIIKGSSATLEIC